MDYTPVLGRVVNHDPRSRGFAAQEADLGALTSVCHVRYIPVLDQGRVGSCTGNALTGNLGSGAFFASLPASLLSTIDPSADEKYALGVYEAAQVIDGNPPYPQSDSGSSGLSVAKVAKNRGLIDSYAHAFSLTAALTALATQPVIVGTSWHTDMFNPDSDGRLHPGGTVAGGHEYELDQLDVENRRVWMCNSWATSWGIGGRAYLTWDDLGALLADQGDCTILKPISRPAPVPPAPSPTPVPADPQALFVAQAEAWVALRHAGRNEAFAEHLKTYLATLGN